MWKGVRDEVVSKSPARFRTVRKFLVVIGNHLTNLTDQIPPPFWETSARTQTVAPCRVPRFSNLTFAPSSSVTILAVEGPARFVTRASAAAHKTIKPL